MLWYQNLVLHTQNRTTEDKHKSKSVRAYLRGIANAPKENAIASRLALMSLNEEVTQAAPSNPVNHQDASNDGTVKETGTTTSIRRKLRQMFASKGPLRLIDLIPDCFEYIFNELSFADLINVAGACTFLQTNASEFFISHAKSHELIIDCDDYPRYIVKMQSNRWPHEFRGRDFDAFLFAFNDVIEKLTIINLFPLRADEERKQNDAKIERSIANAFAGKGKLSELKFTRCGLRMMTQPEHTSSLEFHVESVTFDRCILGDCASNWPMLFPNMQKLAIIDCDVSMVRQCIEKPFPHLKCFELIAKYLNENTWFDCTFSIPNVKRAIDENPNIQKLALCYWNDSAYDAKLLKYANEHLPSLESLHLWHLQYTEFFSEGAIDFLTVRKLTLANDFFHSEKLKRNLASLTFFALEKFYLFGHYDAECVAFLTRHQHIEKFVCHPNGSHSHYPTDFDLKTFGNALPQLKILCISGNHLTPAGLIRFISECATVSFIKIRNLVFSPEIRKRFGADCKERGWKVSYVDDVSKIVLKKM